MKTTTGFLKRKKLSRRGFLKGSAAVAVVATVPVVVAQKRLKQTHRFSIQMNGSIYWIPLDTGDEV